MVDVPGAPCGERRPPESGSRPFNRRDACQLLALHAGLLGSLGLAGPVRAHDHVAEFGVFPYMPALKLEELYGSMTAVMGEVLGRPVQLRTKDTFEAFHGTLHQGSYEVILVHPFFLVEAIDHFGYTPLARVAGDLQAMVLAKAGSGVVGIDGLKGRQLAMPPRLAGVSYLMEMSLHEHGLVPGIDVALRHFRTKASCLHAVAIGDADGCVLPNFMLEQIDAIDEMDLVVVAESRPIPNLVFAAANRLDPAMRERLALVLTGLEDSERGRAALAQARLPGLLPTRDEEFDAIRAYALGANLYSTY
jgi:ABC-type phosphate/phosphonate transport system substrate-binding protein